MEKTILELIDSQIYWYESLIKLSEEMYLAIIERKLDRLLEITNKQSEIIRELFSFRGTDVDGLHEGNFESSISKLTPEEQDIVREKVKYLGELIMKLDDLVKINSRLLNQSIELLQKYIEFLKKNTSSGPIFLEDRG